MKRGLINPQYLSDIANAIREKNGSTTTYTPAEIAPAIREIRCLDNTLSFIVENPIVAAYMENINYDPSDYSTTDVISYYRTPTNYRKDQPNAGPVPIKKTGLLQVFDRKGRIERAVSAGTATITASCNGHTATCAITVRAAELVYTVTSTGAVHGVKISSSDHTTETTGQAAYAATDYVSTANYTNFRLSNNYDGLSYGGTATNNVYLNWYDSSKNYISSTETVGTNPGAAMTPLTGTIPDGAAYYRLRAYCGEAAKREAWFDAFVVELGRYEQKQ